MQERLQKLMAHAGLGSRRSCEQLIERGRVTVNGKAASLGDKANPYEDKIVVDGQPLSKPAKPIYIMVHKPRNVISDDDDRGRKTVRDMIDVPGHLYPVGRLDNMSVGLVLMTNDGDMAHHLTHPRYRHEKVYRVKVDGSMNTETIDKWKSGVYLDDGRTLPAKVKATDRGSGYTWLEVTLREGRKRQIRRVAAKLGHSVQHLARMELGPLKLGSLGLGKWRFLTDREIEQLRKYVAGGEKNFQEQQKKRKSAASKLSPSKQRVRPKK
ncbi:MAG: 23S rRNA pseudouridine2605 synthase [Candidatus Promineifilaceae bacterium]|jgi:23S rRNA pseudouridine2605 synthase